MIIERFIQIFVGQMFMIIIFSYLTFQLLHKKKTHTAKILSIFFISLSIGFALNIILLFIEDEVLQLILYYMSMLSVFGGPIFITLATMLLYKANGIVTPTTKRLECLILGIFYFLFIIIIIFVDGVDLSGEKPVYSFELVISLLILSLIIVYIPAYYYMYKIWKLFKGTNIIKSWRLFFLGIVLLNLDEILLFINSLNTQIPLWWLILNMILMILGPILLQQMFIRIKK